jgi:hypothetical protein
MESKFFERQCVEGRGSRVERRPRQTRIWLSTLDHRLSTFLVFVQPARRRRIRHEVNALHFRDRFDNDLVAVPLGAREHVVRQADVLRRVLGVPHELLGECVLGIEMQIAEQTLACAKFDTAHDA